MRLQSKPRHIAACTTASLALAAAILLTGCGGGGGGAPAPSNSTNRPSIMAPPPLQATTKMPLRLPLVK